MQNSENMKYTIGPLQPKLIFSLVPGTLFLGNVLRKNDYINNAIVKKKLIQSVIICRTFHPKYVQPGHKPFNIV